MAVIELVLVLAVVVICFYKWATSKYDFFDKRNIPYEKPFMCFGTFKGLLFKDETMFDSLKRIHKKFVNEKIYGVFEIRNPVFVINDPELIKQITVKDFDHFVNHRTVLEVEDDSLLGNSLINMHDQKWKDMRSTLTPAFTGNKMRVMFQLIQDCCEESVKYLKEQSKSNSNCIVLDMKDFFTRFTNDVIATSAFGIKVNSLVDKNNEFYEMGKNINNFTGWMMLKVFLFTYFKTIMRFFKIKLFDQKQSNYFTRLVLDAMKYRLDNNIVRPDMIHMLLEARKSPEKSHNREWNDDEIVAQCFAFFVAGFEPTAISMCMAAHELMENPDIQEKLITEIDDVKEKLNGKPLTYEFLQSMKYLDMVISETLRKWPSALFVDRVCKKPYVLNDGKRELNLEVNDVCWVNITGMHFDPRFFPIPDKFDPERFSDDNKTNIVPCTYAPFGLGPRSCIGNRFALMESKAVLFYLLSEYTFEASEKTCIPLKLEPGGFMLKPIGGFWLKLRLRNQ